MYSSTAGRSILRASSRLLLASTAKAKAKAAPSPFRIPTTRKQPRLFSCPVEITCCMQPYHTATASALMTSKLTLSTLGYACLPQACNDDV